MTMHQKKFDRRWWPTFNYCKVMYLCRSIASETSGSFHDSFFSRHRSCLYTNKWSPVQINKIQGSQYSEYKSATSKVHEERKVWNCEMLEFRNGYKMTVASTYV